MSVCPTCGERVSERLAMCPKDGTRIAHVEAPDPMIGRTLGNFHVERLLAKGGMGSVYVARHVKLGTTAVVKILPADLEQDHVDHRRFENEARLATQIQHPHVVRIYDFGEVRSDAGERLIYIVMELVDGEDAGETLEREGRLVPLRVARLLRQVASALEAAHASPAGVVVHRDLKPSNIRLTRRGREEHAIVLDFGIAKAIDAPADTPLTQQGMVIGTPHFMAPEQAMGAAIDARADIYSLGVVAYNLLSGKLPFDAPSTGQVLRQQAFMATPPFPADLPLPAGLGEIVMKCMAKKPDDRFQSAAELVEALDVVIAEATPRRERWALVAVVTVVAIAAIVATYALRNPRAPLSAHLGALSIAGKTLGAGERAYVREATVALEGEVADAARGTVVARRAGAKDIEAPLDGGRFRLQLADLPADEALSIALLLRADEAEAALGALTALRDTRPPRLSPRAAPGEDYAIDLAAQRIYLRKARAVVPFDVVDENPLPADALSARAALPLLVTASAGRGVDLDARNVTTTAACELTLRARDAAGNATDARWSVVRAKEPPKVEIEDVSFAEGRLAIRVAAVGPVGIVDVLLDGTGPAGPLPSRPPVDLRAAGEGGRVLARFETALEAEGEYALRVVARDRAGNRAEAKRTYRHAVPFGVTLAVRAGDRALAPAADGTIYTSSREVKVEIAGSKPVASAAVTLPSGTTFILPAPGKETAPLAASMPLAPNGTQSVKVRVKSKAGDEAVQELRIVHDDLPPSVAVLSPTPWPDPIGLSATTGTALALEVSLTDASPPTTISLSYSFDGGPETRVTPALAGGRARVTLPLVDGLIALTIGARDRAGNEASITRRARVDLKPPVIVAEPVQARFKLHETAAVRVRTDEDCRQVTVDGATARIRADGERTWVFETPMLLDTPLGHAVAATDLAGNRAEVPVTLARENVCAATGSALSDEQVAALLRGPARFCPFCGQAAVKSGGKSP